jgi:hypothetical protein
VEPHKTRSQLYDAFVSSRRASICLYTTTATWLPTKVGESLELELNRIDDHPTSPVIPTASTSTNPPPLDTAAADSQRPPETFEEFLAQLATVVRSGGGLTVDEDLYDEIFDGEDGLGRR